MFRQWLARRAAKKADALQVCEVCHGPLGENPRTRYYRTCSEECEEAAGSNWTM